MTCAGSTLVHVAMTAAERKRLQRQRERAGLEADPAAHLRDADELVSPALEVSLEALDLKPEDAAAVALARAYARVLDTARDPAWSARWIGPLYLASLESLRATPMSRKAAKPSPQGPSRLDELRMRRVSVPSHGPGA